MKNQSNRHTLSAELIAAYMDGNATAAECRQVLEAIKHDAQLRELLQVSLHVDAEMGLLLQRTNHLPIAAMAANCEEGSFCCLECEITSEKSDKTVFSPNDLERFFIMMSLISFLSS